MIANLKRDINRLINQTVTHKRTLGNALVLYFEDIPGEEKTQLFHFDPSWRYEQEGRIITGSGDIPWDEEGFENEAEFEAEFDRVCNLPNALLDSKLLSYQLNEKTNELALHFEGNQVIRTFANGVKDYHWIFKTGERHYYMFADKIEVKLKKKNAP